MRSKPDLSGLSGDDVKRFIAGNGDEGGGTHTATAPVARPAPARSTPPSDALRTTEIPGSSDIDRTQSVFHPTKKEKPTIQKTFRFPPSLSNALKRRATDESIRTGERVTEVEIVMTAVKEFLDRS